MASGVRHRAVFDRSSEILRGDGPDIFPSIVPRPPEPAPETAYADRQSFPEIDCVRSLLPDDVIKAAERRAAKIGVSADRVLITAGTLSEESYLRRLAATLDVRFETFDGIERVQCPLGDERLLEAAAAGLLPLAADGDLKLVVAPRGAAIRRIIELIGDKPELAQRFRFTTEERLRGFISRHTDIIGERAAQSLHNTWPELSAAPPRWRANKGPASAGVLAMLAFFILPAQTALAFEILLAVVFLGWMALRLIGALIDWRHAAPFPLGLRDDELPVYTIVSALYREASSVDGLLAAIERLDYPAEKLDVKIVLEADDDDTRAAIDARHCRIPIDVIVAPPVGPRTKPKALNVALPFARGAFIVIYDAEDRPEP
ncbi:MAG TPA: glycosyl transferase, partial [Pseudolabrys sp.]|nr:glycosyl transferase [Pseudolabrys sp.]